MEEGNRVIDCDLGKENLLVIGHVASLAAAYCQYWQGSLPELQEEMERRFSLFEKECVSDVGEYNKKAAEKLSTIIALVSYEASKDAIKGLLGKCVAAGISLLVYANSLDSVDEETKGLTTLLK